jgi:tetratricopeptide (TPR) repeat protein
MKKLMKIRHRNLPICFLTAIVFLVMVSCATLTSYQARSEYDTGLALFNRGQFSEAIPCFERTTEIDPDFAMAYLYLGRSYVSTGNYTKAINPLRTAYRLSPDNVKNQVLDILLDALLNAVQSETKKQ